MVLPPQTVALAMILSVLSTMQATSMVLPLQTGALATIRSVSGIMRATTTVLPPQTGALARMRSVSAQVLQPLSSTLVQLTVPRMS